MLLLFLIKSKLPNKKNIRNILKMYFILLTLNLF